MNKRELLLALKMVPEDAQIMVASDEEWNRLNPAYALDKTKVMTENGGEYSAIADEDAAQYEDEEISEVYVLWG